MLNIHGYLTVSFKFTVSMHVVDYFDILFTAGYQTIGEEYVNVIQVDRTQRRIPSPLVIELPCKKNSLLLSIHLLSETAFKGR